MPYRDWFLPTSPYDIGFDRWGSDWDDRAQMLDSQPRGGEDEQYDVERTGGGTRETSGTPGTAKTGCHPGPSAERRCETCGREIAARELCVACGEDMAA